MTISDHVHRAEKLLSESESCPQEPGLIILAAAVHALLAYILQQAYGPK